MPDIRKVHQRGNCVHVHVHVHVHVRVRVVRSSLEVNAGRMSDGDGARIRGPTALRLANGEGVEVPVFDLRPNELLVMPR